MPKEIDTEAFDLVSVNEEEAVFQKYMELVNYSGYTFSLQIDRTVRILDASDMASTLSMSLPDNIDYVGYHTINTLTIWKTFIQNEYCQ